RLASRKAPGANLQDALTPTRVFERETCAHRLARAHEATPGRCEALPSIQLRRPVETSSLRGSTAATVPFGADSWCSLGAPVRCVCFLARCQTPAQRARRPGD